jgi:hypothetical protein
MTIDVTLLGSVSTSSTGGCGQFAPAFNSSTGQLVGGTIQLFDATTTGYDCEPDRSETIAHELGHVLGLGDISAQSCYGHIMGPHLIGGQISVQPDECAAADSNWTTPAEAAPPSGGGDADPYSKDSICFQGKPGCPDSPIIINFENGAYRLSGANHPVSFDMAGSGQPRLMGWTATGADEAFLWLDRNHNGRVTSGAELFGNFTPLQNGQLAKNGFDALAEYDANHDGVINDSDPIWSKLLLWRDLNHNGISEPSEISPLDASDVSAIDLHYHWTGRHDQWGNAFRYDSLISISNRSGHGMRKQPVYDIFFVSVAK